VRKVDIQAVDGLAVWAGRRWIGGISMMKLAAMIQQAVGSIPVLVAVKAMACGGMSAARRVQRHRLKWRSDSSARMNAIPVEVSFSGRVWWWRNRARLVWQIRQSRVRIVRMVAVARRLSRPHVQ